MNIQRVTSRIMSAAVALSLVLGFIPSAFAKGSDGHHGSHYRYHGDHLTHRYHRNSHHYNVPYRYGSLYGYGHHGSYRGAYPYSYRYTRRYPYEERSAIPSRTVWSDLIREGDTLFKTSDFSVAAERFKAATEIDPTHPISHFAYGHTLFALGRYAESARAIREGMTRYPDWGKVRMNRRSAYRDPTEFDQRLSRLEAWVEAHPDQTDVGFLLGYYYYFTQQSQRAQETFHRVVEFDPHDRQARYFLTFLTETPDVS